MGNRTRTKTTKENGKAFLTKCLGSVSKNNEGEWENVPLTCLSCLMMTDFILQENGFGCASKTTKENGNLPMMTDSILQENGFGCASKTTKENGTASSVLACVVYSFL